MRRDVVSLSFGLTIFRKVDISVEKGHIICLNNAQPSFVFGRFRVRTRDPDGFRNHTIQEHHKGVAGDRGLISCPPLSLYFRLV